MKTTKIIIAASVLLSFNVNANLLQYNLNLVTTDVEGAAFGGVSIGDIFQGEVAIDTQILQAAVNTGGGSSTVFVPLSHFDAGTSSDVFNLSYSFNVGDHTFTERTADSFESEFTVDSRSNVQNVTAFSFQVGDSSVNNLEIFYGASGGEWSATDDFSSNVIHGTFSVSQVPVPAAIWMLGSGLIGLVSFRKKMA